MGSSRRDFLKVTTLGGVAASLLGFELTSPRTVSRCRSLTNSLPSL